MKGNERGSNAITLGREVGSRLPDSPDTVDLRAARSEASRLARAAVSGEITAAEARAKWPLDEDVDPSVDAIAHLYFDHFVPETKRRQPDEDDVAGVIELADLMAGGDPLDEEWLRSFEGVSVEFDLWQVLVVLAIIVVLVYVAVRFI